MIEGKESLRNLTIQRNGNKEIRGKSPLYCNEEIILKSTVYFSITGKGCFI